MIIHMPTSLDELWPVLDDSHVRLMAGGTDVLVQRRAALQHGRDASNHAPQSLCCLERIPDLCGIQRTENALRIGATTSLTALLESPDIAKLFPSLHQAIQVLGSPLIRNQATLGGNICTASPAGDSLPPLTVLRAQVELATRHDLRILPIEDFISGPGQTVLRPGEILHAVRIPLPGPGCTQHFEKIGHRRALAISVASLAACYHRDAHGSTHVYLALGSVGPTIMRCPEAETLLRDAPLTRDCLTQAAHLIREAVRPITDIRATADYRRLVAGNLLLRLASVWNVS